MSPRMGTTRDAAEPRAAAIVCQRVGSRTTTTIVESVRRRSDLMTLRPTRPVAPVTRMVREEVMSGLHRERGPMRAVAVREEQEAVTRRDGPGLERIAQVDEVVP